MRKKAAIYIRVSTLDQVREGYSLAAQEKALRKWCKEHGYEVYFVYADEGISGKDIDHRPGMKQLLEDVNGKRFNFIIVWSLSRFTRSVSDLYDTLELLQKYNVSFVSLTEEFDTSTAMGRAMVGICGIFAQLEREITSERISAAMEERASQGKRTCNEVLGYDLDGKDSLKINEAEAERVRYIFNKYLEYKNLSAVAELCRLKGYTGKRGRVQTAESIRKILTRPVYAGYNSYCGQIYKGNHPAIINVETYNKVQRFLEKSIVGRRLQRQYKKLNTTI
ncbi:recombinase family protein [Clostridium sp. D33t1_170424_F3]|uniref:recombinase family protein n=1 Tax=Clostridium sp. D33t1_170424_F3 TaxID=2787099 RepID=UPI0018A8A149